MMLGQLHKVATIRKAFYALLSVAAIFLLSLPLIPQFLPSHSFAEPGVEATTTLSISPSSTLSLIAEPGSFVSGTETINVSTNNYTGYTLTMTTNGSSTDLVSSSSEVTIPTITLPEGVGSITSTDFTTASYGYSLNSTDFMPVPDTASEGVVIATTNAEDPKTNTHDLTFGAKTDTTTPAGTYEQTFTLSAVANAAAYQINYNKNTEETVNNFPSNTETTLSGINVILSSKVPTRTGYRFLGWDEDQTAIEPTYTAGDTFLLDPELGLEDNTYTLYAIWGCGNGYICYDDNGADEVNGGKGTMNPSTLQSSAYSAGASVNLVAPNYSKSGYGFVGWSETPIDPEAEDVKALISTQAQANPRTIYGPNETITMPSPQGPKQLYAVWLKAETTTVDNVETPVYLQSWLGCSELEIGDVTALTDSRDNQVYAVAKLADGSCWQIENMRLDFSKLAPGQEINALNTNNPTSNFVERAKATAPSTNGYSTSATDFKYTTFNINRSLPASHNKSSYNPTGEESNLTSWYSYGVLYNFRTALALHTVTVSDARADGDICPIGWRIPSGKESGEFYALAASLDATARDADSSRKWRSFPNNYVYSAQYGQWSAEEHVNRRGSSGSYWASGTGRPERSKVHITLRFWT